MNPQAMLQNFFGSMTFTCIGSMYRNVYLTEGAKYVWENETGWLITDALPPLLEKWDGYFATVTLTKNKDNTGVLKITDGNQNTLYEKDYEYMSTPFDNVELFVETGSVDGIKEHIIIMLPSER